MRWLERKSFLPRSVRLMHQLVVLGIALSVAALLVVLSVASGFEKEFKKSLLDFHAHLTLLPDPLLPVKPETITQAWVQAGLPAQAIVAIKPYLYREGLLVHQGVIKGVVLKGIPMDGRKEILLGEALAQKLKWQQGETVKLVTFQDKGRSLQGSIPLKVGGMFRSGLYELDEQFALADLAYLQKLFDLPAETKGYEIKLANPDLAPQAAQQLAKQLPAVLIQNWAELHRPLFEAFQLEKWLFKILIGFMIVVSLFNLIAAILLAIFRQKKKIAVLRALGLSQVKLRRGFMGEGVWLGIKGIGLGALLGLGLMVGIHFGNGMPLDPEIYFLPKLPIDFDITDALMIFLFTFWGVVGIAWWAAGRCAAISIREGLHEPG